MTDQQKVKAFIKRHPNREAKRLMVIARNTNKPPEFLKLLEAGLKKGE